MRIPSTTPHPSPIRNPRAGGALLVSLMVVTIVASMGAVLIQSHIAKARTTAVRIDARRAFYVAEAGLSEALLSVAHGNSGTIGTPDQPALFGGGVFWVDSEQDGDRVTLRSTGLAGLGRSSLSVTLERAVDPVSSLGFFSGGDSIVRAGALIDGYDSRDGSFADQVDPNLAGATTGGGGQVGSNGDIVLESIPNLGPGEGAGGTATAVYGQLQPGPDGTLILDPGAYSSSAGSPRGEEAQLTAIDVPRLESAGVPDISRGLLINGGQVGYDSLLVETGATLRIAGPATVVVTDLELQSGANLEFDTRAGSVVLHCLDNVVMSEGSTLESLYPDEDPTMLLISTNIDKRAEALAAMTAKGNKVDRAQAGGGLAEAVENGNAGGNGNGNPGGNENGNAGGSAAEKSNGNSQAAKKNVNFSYPTADLTTPAVVQIAATGTFHGLIYAPLAPVSLPAGLRVLGSIVSSQLTMEEGARLSFDEALTSESTGLGTQPRLVSWRIVELPDEALVRTRLDPLVQLRLRGITPERPDQSYREECIAIEYLDGMGMLNSYSGPYADFISDRVVTVTGIAWYDGDGGELPPPTLPAPPASTPSVPADAPSGLLVAAGNSASGQDWQAKIDAWLARRLTETQSDLDAIFAD